MNDKKVAVLFSGGTDSTLTAALAAERYQKVYLITYQRLGFFSINNTKLNLHKLQSRFGKDKFIHQIIKIDRLFNYVSYERYIRNVIKYGFLLLSTCGLCKMAMHLRTVIFCLDNHISNICDGANQGMYLFPAQMDSVIEEVKKMYARFAIVYTTPVFDFAGPQDVEFTDRLHLESVLPNRQKEASSQDQKKKTTGYKLFELGLMPSDNVKGTELDQKMQPRCFQFMLFNIYVLWYYLQYHSYDQYKQITVRFYKDKLESLTRLLVEYTTGVKGSKLSKLVEK
ncbi:hypothetical protein ACFL1I_00395 [Candidatus Omnitrophota bacterium]